VRPCGGGAPSVLLRDVPVVVRSSSVGQTKYFLEGRLALSERKLEAITGL